MTVWTALGNLLGALATWIRVRLMLGEPRRPGEIQRRPPHRPEGRSPSVEIKEGGKGRTDTITLPVPPNVPPGTIQKGLGLPIDHTKRSWLCRLGRHDKEVVRFEGGRTIYHCARRPACTWEHWERP